MMTLDDLQEALAGAVAAALDADIAVLVERGATDAELEDWLATRRPELERWAAESLRSAMRWLVEPTAPSALQ
jgi:hypothetical protein